jgi:putative DNA primase/helicase
MGFFTQDEKQIDRLFRKGALFRDEWERKSKYTIGNAIDKLDEVYNPEKKGKKKSGEDKPEKTSVPFDVVAEHILKNNPIFTMRDNKQIYIYEKGVYRSEGTEAILDTKIRNIHNEYYAKYWNVTNPKFPLTHILKANTKYVSEALAYIRAYTHIQRDSIEKDEEKYINFKNCLFNLETWEFEDHRPEIKTICQIPVNYNPKAECPQITKFVKDVAQPEDIDFLEEWFGYCLTTDVSYQKALMLYGIPGTGKSVFALLLETFIGKENASAESLQKLEEDKYRPAKLYGKRVNVCSDIPSAKLHKNETFKKLVSGLDTIDAENKYQDPFKFRNKTKLTFTANYVPEGPKDQAFYERFCLIEFSNKFRGTEKDDRQLITKLTEENELSGLLNVALNGLKRLYENK